MDSPDQLTLTARLATGGLATVHLEGGRSRGAGFEWRIHATEDDLLLRADWTHPQFGELVLYDGAGTELDRQQAAPAHTVAAAYRRIADDLREGTHTAPDFTEGAALQRLLADSLTR
jgi:predicted dehydrogenase